MVKLKTKLRKFVHCRHAKFSSVRNSLFKPIKSKSKRLLEVVTYSIVGKSAKNPTEKAHLFNEFFSTVFTKIVPGRMEFPCDVIQPDLLLQVSKSRNQVKDILTKRDSTKSTGVDGISARVLKECAGELSYPLTLLFNLSFQIGNVPVSWKRANVTPVFKSEAKKKLRTIALYHY